MPAERIVCLTTETTEVLYLFGEQARIFGISGHINRPGWNTIPAVQNGFVHEIKSVDILQPGPSIITHGLKQLQAIIQQWRARQACNKHWG